MNIINDLKQTFKSGSTLSRLIYVNLAVFLVFNLIYALMYMSNAYPETLLEWLALPADISVLVSRPWTIITYMFLHQSFMHVLFNLMILYWFGKIFLKYLSQRQLLSVYILGGLTGAAFYIAAYNLLPIFSIDKIFSVAIGASASVIAILVAVATIVPKQEVYLMFFGKVQLIYIALFIVVIDLIQIPVNNPGGHIAHLGGAALGFLFATSYKKGKDFTPAFSRFLDKIFSLFKKEDPIKVSYRNKNKKKHTRNESDMNYNARKKSEQNNINQILEKVATSGYGSLTPKEKEQLFKSSNKK